MRILVDENIPRMTAEHLRELGHDVRDVRGSADQGLADAALWNIALEERRLLVTTDKGFTEYRATWIAPGLQVEQVVDLPAEIPSVFPSIGH